MSNFDSEHEIKIPGKLFIAGEYAVLEPNQKAIVIAVNRFIVAKIKESDHFSVKLPQLGFEKVTWEYSNNKAAFSETDERLQYVQQAVSVVCQFLNEKQVDLKPLEIEITSNLDDDSGKKYGLGSSAAIVVAMVSSILKWHKNNYQASLEEVFKLASIAHIHVQGNGSCADIAASTFGGWISYSSFRIQWLHNELDKGVSIAELVMKTWPMLTVSQLTPPDNLSLCVGWTKEVMKTGPMVKRIQEMKNNDQVRYEQFLQNSSTAVANLIASFEENDYHAAISSLSENRQALQSLGEAAGVAIESPTLKLLADIADKYGAGKSSGAGGGDCGIAFLMDEKDRSKLYEEWEESAIVPLDLAVSPVGTSI